MNQKDVSNQDVVNAIEAHTQVITKVTASMQKNNDATYVRKDIMDVKLDGIHKDVKGVLSHLATLNGKVIKNSGWIMENGEFVSDLKKGRKKQRSKAVDLGWDLIKMGVVSIVSVMGALLGFDKFIK